MNSSKVLYINMFQLLADNETIRQHPSVEDFNRKCFVTVTHNAGPSTGLLSAVLMEFAGQRTKFVSLLTFDGSGSYGASLNSFSMPRQKLTLLTKALLTLSVLDYLIKWNYIDAEFDFYIDKISHDFDGGVCDIRKRYADLCRRSEEYIKAKEANAPAFPDSALALVQ